MPIKKAIGRTAAWLTGTTVASAASPALGAAAIVGGAAYGGARVGAKALKNPSSLGSKALFTTVAAGAAVAGGASELVNPDGPWRDVAEGVTGSSNFIEHTARASYSAAFATNNFEYNQGPLEYYEGGNVNPQALQRRRNVMAPDGSMVMGMYNRRRG